MTTLDVCCGFRYPGGFRLRAEFEANAGITALVGASGSGKSTLVALLAGSLRPDSGTIHYRGRIWSDARSSENLPPELRRVGVAYQDNRLFPHLSVRGNLLYGRRRFRPARPAFDEVVGALEIGDLLARRPGGLSGGQAQRVCLGRALLASEGLLLLDEPVSSLDGPLRSRVVEFLSNARSPDRTIVVVSHDLKAIARLQPDCVLRAESGWIRPDEHLAGHVRDVDPHESIAPPLLRGR